MVYAATDGWRATDETPPFTGDGTPPGGSPSGTPTAVTTAEADDSANGDDGDSEPDDDDRPAGDDDRPGNSGESSGSSGEDEPGSTDSGSPSDSGDDHAGSAESERPEPGTPAPSGSQSPSPSDDPEPSPSDTESPSQQPDPSPSQDPDTTPTPAPELPLPDLSEIEDDLVDALRTERAEAGCQDLRVDARLMTAARAHSVDMAVRSFYSHTNPDGETPADRAAEVGYRAAVGENISFGLLQSAGLTVNGWTIGVKDRENLLDCDYRSVGVGMESTGAVSSWWTLMLGRD